MIHWSNQFSCKEENNFVISCVNSSKSMKKISYETYKEFKRSMTASDIISYITKYVCGLN